MDFLSPYISVAHQSQGIYFILQASSGAQCASYFKLSSWEVPHLPMAILCLTVTLLQEDK